MLTFDEGEVEVVVDVVGMEAAKDIFHEQSSSSSQFDYSELSVDFVGERIYHFDCWRLHENS